MQGVFLGIINFSEQLTKLWIVLPNQAVGPTFFDCSSLTAVTFLGDAPEIDNDAFEKSSPTIYRKPEAKGWSDTLAGRPVKLITEKS